jgi:PAS domain S-box-containing protein
MNSVTAEFLPKTKPADVEFIPASRHPLAPIAGPLHARRLVIAESPEARGDFCAQANVSADGAGVGREAFAKIRAAADRGQPYAIVFVDEASEEMPDELLALDPQLQVVICTSRPSDWRERLLAKPERSDRLVILKKPFDSIETVQLTCLLAAKWTLAREAQVRAGELSELVRQHHQDLRLHRERLAMISRASNDAIWDWDMVADEMWWNEAFAAMFGHVQEERKGGLSRWLKRVHPEEVDRVITGLRAALDGRQSFWSDEYRFRRADSLFATVNARGQIVRDVAGKAVRMVGAMHDVTERRHAERERHELEVQLRQAQKLESIGQLASGVAHEINTPMQYIGDNTRFVREAFNDLKKVLGAGEQLLAAARAGPVSPAVIAEMEAAKKNADLDYLSEEIPKAMGQTIEGIERVSRIVRAMKDFSQPGVEKTLLDINKAIESTLIVCRNEWKYVADLSTDFDATMPALAVMPGEFNQAVLALILNAAQAIAEKVGDGGGGKGQLSLSTRRRAASVEIRVRDTGTGIPEKIRDRIFDPFFTTKPVGRGAGQGLTLARAVIVERHGGTLSFETEEGVGTCFIVRLPLVELAGGKLSELNNQN